MESQKGLAEQSLPLTGEGMHRGDCMHSLTEKTRMALDEKLEHASAGSGEYFLSI
jgi:hypothetical protein